MASGRLAAAFPRCLPPHISNLMALAFGALAHIARIAVAATPFSLSRLCQRINLRNDGRRGAVV
jgi:hypothetical protein